MEGFQVQPQIQKTIYVEEIIRQYDLDSLTLQYFEANPYAPKIIGDLIKALPEYYKYVFVEILILGKTYDQLNENFKQNITVDEFADDLSYLNHALRDLNLGTVLDISSAIEFFVEKVAENKYKQIQRDKVVPLNEIEWADLSSVLGIPEKLQEDLLALLQRHTAYFTRLLYCALVLKINNFDIQENYFAQLRGYFIERDIETAQKYIEKYLNNQSDAEYVNHYLYNLAYDRGFIKTFKIPADVSYIEQFHRCDSKASFEEFIALSFQNNIQYTYTKLKESMKFAADFELFENFTTNLDPYYQFLLLRATPKFDIPPLKIFGKLARLKLVDGDYSGAILYSDLKTLKTNLKQLTTDNCSDLIVKFAEKRAHRIVKKVKNIELVETEEIPLDPIVLGETLPVEPEPVDISYLDQAVSFIEQYIQDPNSVLVSSEFLNELDAHLKPNDEVKLSNDQIVLILNLLNELIARVNELNTKTPGRKSLLIILLINENRYWLMTKARKLKFKDPLSNYNLSKLDYEYIQNSLALLLGNPSFGITTSLDKVYTGLSNRVSRKDLTALFIFIKNRSKDAVNTRFYRILIHLLEVSKFESTVTDNYRKPQQSYNRLPQKLNGNTREPEIVPDGGYDDTPDEEAEKAMITNPYGEPRIFDQNGYYQEG